MGSFSRFVFFVGLCGIIFMAFFGEVRTIQGFKISLATELPSFNEAAINEAINKKGIERTQQQQQQQQQQRPSSSSSAQSTKNKDSAATRSATATTDTTAEKLRILKASATALEQKRILITEPEQPPAHLRGRARKAWLRRQKEQQEKSTETVAVVVGAVKEEEKLKEEAKPAGKEDDEEEEAEPAANEGEKEEEEKEPAVAKSKDEETGTKTATNKEEVEEEEEEEEKEKPEESTTSKAAAKTTSAAATPAKKHIPASELPPSSNEYNHKLQVADYLAAPPTRATKEWLNQCATEMRNDKTLVKPFPTQRPQYALGDCILKCNKCDYGYLVPHPKKRSRMVTVGNITFAYQYGQKACPNRNGKSDDNKRRDLDLTSDIIREFETYPWFLNVTAAPHPDAVVLHFRLGDVVELQAAGAGTLLNKGGIGRHPKHSKRHIKSIRSFYEYLDTIDENYQQRVANTTTAASDKNNNNNNNKLPQKKVVIVGGSHKPHLFSTSRIYSNCIQRGLAMAGYDTEMILDNGDADADFYYMTNAKIFMTSTGGFSALIADMVKKNGGQVIGRDLN